MDDKPHGAHVARAFPLWRPERNLYGDVEVSINYLHEASGRISWASVSPQRLHELMEKGLLDFQRDTSIEKQPHVPTLEQLLEFLEYERAGRTAQAGASGPRGYAAAFAGRLGPSPGWRPPPKETTPDEEGSQEPPEPDPGFESTSSRRGRAGFHAQRASREEKLEAFHKAKAKLIGQGTKPTLKSIAYEASKILGGRVQPDSLYSFMYAGLLPEEKKALMKPPDT